MSDFQAIADRVEIEALRAEFTDAVMMRDYDRVASLFTARRRPAKPGPAANQPAGSKSPANRPCAQEVTVTVTEAPNPRPVDGCVVQPWMV
jgi:hypothetical protein